MSAYRIRLVSQLAAEAPAVWAHASSMDGVNAELAPIRMSAPPGARIDETVPLGTPLFVSTVSIRGVVPFDLHELTLVDVVPGRGFREVSRSLLQARWNHVRTIEPRAAGGCSLEDEVTFIPRVSGPIARRIVAWVFRRRHAWLRRRFGGTGPLVIEQSDAVS
jgi:hypothetical protein